MLQLFELSHDAMLGLVVSDPATFDELVDAIVEEQHELVCQGTLASKPKEDQLVVVLDEMVRLAGIRTAHILEALHTPSSSDAFKKAVDGKRKAKKRDPSKKRHAVHKIGKNWFSDMVKNMSLAVVYVPCLLLLLTRLDDIMKCAPS